MIPWRGRGLTLVEVLVALAILGLLSMLAYRALDSTFRVRDRVSVEAERWRELSFFFDRLRDDVAQPSSRGSRFATGDRRPIWQGDASSFDLAAFGNGQNPLRQIQYSWREGAVELRLWPTFDAAPGATPEVHRIVGAVRTLRFSYLDPSRRWVAIWPGSAGGADVPLAVRVELTMDDGIRLSRIFAVR